MADSPTPSPTRPNLFPGQGQSRIPDLLDGSSAWDLLTKQEREIITPKIKPNGGQTVYEAFNERFGKKDIVGHLDRQATEVNVIHVVNFIDRAGGRKNSPMWQQISELKTITYPHL